MEQLYLIGEVLETVGQSRMETIVFEAWSCAVEGKMSGLKTLKETVENFAKGHSGGF